MPSFSKQSLDKLATVDRRLYDICTEVIKNYDITILVGHRNKEDQDAACAAIPPRSKDPWPTSKHNSCPSQAVDLAPYNNGIDWNDIDKFKELAGHMFTAADKLGIKIRWGGSFTTLKDYDHYELVEV